MPVLLVTEKQILSKIVLLVTGVSVYGGPQASALLRIAETTPFHLEYNTLTCIIEIVNDDVSAADLIHQHGRFVQLSVHICSVINVPTVVLFMTLLPTGFLAVLILLASLLKILKLLKLS